MPMGAFLAVGEGPRPASDHNLLALGDPVRPRRPGGIVTSMGGYADRIAHVNLSSRKIEYEPVDPEMARKYIGGRGLGDKLVFDAGQRLRTFAPGDPLLMA